MLEDTKANRLAQLEEAKAGYDVSKMDSATLMEIAKNASQNREKELDRLMHKGMSETQANATIKSAEIHVAGQIKSAGITSGATLEAARIKAATDKTAVLYPSLVQKTYATNMAQRAKELNTTIDGLSDEDRKNIMVTSIGQVDEIMGAAENYKSGKSKSDKNDPLGFR
jgi:hypothetical protein